MGILKRSLGQIYLMLFPAVKKRRNKYLDAETDNFIGLSFQEVVLASEKFLKGNTMIQGLSNNHFKALGLCYHPVPGKKF